MKHSLLKIVLAISAGTAFLSNSALASDANGAGATFPYAVYTKWASAYHKATGKKINYQGIGSSGGIKQINAKTVDFGGTDAPVSLAKLNQRKQVQVPTVMGGVTIVFNLSGFKSGGIRLDGKTVADIFRGKVKKWNSDAIRKLNPKVTLPNKYITIVHRSDGSGTTANFTKYLAMQSSAFKKQVGAGKVVDWPSKSVGGKGNPGVSANVVKINGAIGYVDIADAMKNNLPFIALKNKAGKFITPSQQAVADAAGGANFDIPSMAPNMLDQTHPNAWPITTATYIIVYKKAANATRQKEVVNFVKWSLNNGQKMAQTLGFVALPKNVVKKVEAKLATVK